MLLTESEKKRLLYLLDNCELIKGGKIEGVYQKRPYENSIWLGNRHILIRDTIKITRRTDNKILYVYIKKRGWLFYKWITVSGEPEIDGPWWDVIRREIPLMEKEINVLCDPKDTVADWSTTELAGALSIVEEKKE